MMDREYHRDYARKYYQKKKAEFLILLGGKCTNCGSVTDLEFDHIDPKTKKFSISKFLNYSKDEALKELKKCQLLCKECHKVKTVCFLKSKTRTHLSEAYGKLTAGQVTEIRKKLSEGEGPRAIAKQYGVHRGTIQNIKKGKSWKL